MAEHKHSQHIGQHSWWGLYLHWAWLPFIGFCFGAATILTLIIIWLASGSPKYQPTDASITYISDVGGKHKPVFITLGTITAVLFFASLWLDFQLRHTQRIPARRRTLERVATFLSLVAGFVCAVACILLTIFDTYNYNATHWTCAAIFFIALLVSGAFNMVEIAALTRDYRGDKLLKASFSLKVLIVVVGLGCIMAFGVLMGVCSSPENLPYDRCNTQDSIAAVFEWVITALFCLYILTICLDLYPSRRTSKHVKQPNITPIGTDTAPAVAFGAAPPDRELQMAPASMV
jgi:uncharacterized membrane protein